MKFSVIVATRNEGAQIVHALKRLRQISRQSPMEVIVVDGASSDGTAALARDWADQVLSTPEENHGAQLDMGARKASGDLVFFLSADTQPPGNWQQALEHYWLKSQPKAVAATAFTVEYGSEIPMRLAARWVNRRVRWRGLATADHGLCTTPELYQKSGGFPAFAYGADRLFCERLSRFGKIALLPERIHPAARKLRRRGVLRLGLQRAWLDLRQRLGADPSALWRAYAGL